MTYIDPGAGSLLFQAIAGLLIGWVATLGRFRKWLMRFEKKARRETGAKSDETDKAEEKYS